ncbi:MAG: YheU family protein [Acidobacteria bacterium]|nr:YheU family protein [Acidobacteriota bacterium]
MEHQDDEAEQAAPVRLSPEDLAPETLRAVVESFVLREGTDYGVTETSLDDKVAQVLAQLRRGDAHIVFDPPTGSVSIVVTRALEGLVE